MLYWLFTDGRVIFSILLLPLFCAAPLLTLITAGALDTGIRRTHDDGAKASSLEQFFLGVTYSAVMLTVTAIYLSVLSGAALNRCASQRRALITWMTATQPAHSSRNRAPPIHKPSPDTFSLAPG